jgi:AcrR family transcriptional regulator
VYSKKTNVCFLRLRPPYSAVSLSAVPKRKPSADRILEAAEAVFVRHGYGETSLRQLMSGARVSTTAFYARFRSKEEVLRALVVRLLQELEERARTELAKSATLEDGFARGADVLYEVLAPKRALVRILLTEAAASPGATRALGGLYSGLATFLAGRFGALVAGVDTGALAWGVVGALNMQIVRWAVFEDVGTAALRATLQATANAFLPALSAPGVRKKRAKKIAS